VRQLSSVRHRSYGCLDTNLFQRLSQLLLQLQLHSSLQQAERSCSAHVYSPQTPRWNSVSPYWAVECDYGILTMLEYHCVSWPLGQGAL